MNFPTYTYPPGLLARVARDILLARPRDFRRDAKVCIQALKPPLQVLGKEWIPRRGPCVLTVNHYHRSGFGAQWIPLAIAAPVPVPIHWIITAELTEWGKRYGTLGMIGSRTLLKRIAGIYGFTTMPPRPKEVEARAAAVRAVLQYARQTRDPVLGLAPEGQDAPAAGLTRPAAGVGRFGLLLSQAGLKFVPVSAYEMDGIFHLHFGEGYELKVAPGLSPEERDAAAAQIMMKNIARLLPSHLRGEFA